MAERRVILGARAGYSLLPLIPGMFEYMLQDGRDSEWHREYSRLLMAVWGTGYVEKYNRRRLPAVRNIPIETALANHHSVAVSADLMSEMIDRHEFMGMLKVCQCRQSLRFQGRECQRATPEHGCLIFGSFAQVSEKAGNARLVSKAEMKDIVAERWERKLVFLTGNVGPESPNAICTCCDCCCHFLETVNHWKGKALVAPPHFLATVDTERCKNCGKCVKACNTHAHTLVAKRHVYEQAKCLGCGACVSVCQEQAISMAPNPAYKPPAKGFGQLGLKLLHWAALTSMRVKFGH
jgi:NAD-dependent dihydropyrimidine dehydrogenase PreA subunit